jgi:hypothetical protein
MKNFLLNYLINVIIALFVLNTINTFVNIDQKMMVGIIIISWLLIAEILYATRETNQTTDRTDTTAHSNP